MFKNLSLCILIMLPVCMAQKITVFIDTTHEGCTGPNSNKFLSLIQSNIETHPKFKDKNYSVMYSYSSDKTPNYSLRFVSVDNDSCSVGGILYYVNFLTPKWDNINHITFDEKAYLCKKNEQATQSMFVALKINKFI